MTSHWEATYARTAEAERSWSEDQAATSLEFIADSGIDKTAPVLDVGGGASRLVDGLVERGYTNVTVVDLSASALQEAKARVGDRATFVESDLLSYAAPQPVALWHDRAVLHFFTDVEQRHAYVDQVARSVAPSGAVVLACFALDGPEQCSGLTVARASVEDLVELFGPRFSLQASATLSHHTPWDAVQRFTWVRFTRLGEPLDA